MKLAFYEAKRPKVFAIQSPHAAFAADISDETLKEISDQLKKIDPSFGLTRDGGHIVVYGGMGDRPILLPGDYIMVSESGEVSTMGSMPFLAYYEKSQYSDPVTVCRCQRKSPVMEVVQVLKANWYGVVIWLRQERVPYALGDNEFELTLIDTKYKVTPGTYIVKDQSKPSHSQFLCYTNEEFFELFNAR
jgi:hypothetical protein